MLVFKRSLRPLKLLYPSGPRFKTSPVCEQLVYYRLDLRLGETELLHERSIIGSRALIKTLDRGDHAVFRRLLVSGRLLPDVGGLRDGCGSVGVHAGGLCQLLELFDVRCLLQQFPDLLLGLLHRAFLRYELGEAERYEIRVFYLAHDLWLDIQLAFVLLDLSHDIND